MSLQLVPTAIFRGAVVCPALSALIGEGLKITDNIKLSLILSARNTEMQQLAKKAQEKFYWLYP